MVFNFPGDSHPHPSQSMDTTHRYMEFSREYQCLKVGGVT